MGGSSAIFASWAFPIVPFLGLCTAGVLYWRGWRQLTRQVPDRFPWWRLAAFLLGLAVVWVAVASPLDALSGWLLMVHMLQHLLLTMVAPPLLLCGAPMLPILRGLPRIVARDAIGPFLTWPLLQRVGGVLVHPMFAGPLFMVSNIFWHVPALYELALSSTAWHQVEHAVFLTTATLFWWPVIQPWPARPVWPRWAMIPYLLVADIQNTALAAFVTFSDRVLYPSYLLAPKLASLTTLEDQAAAGVLMWVPGSMAFLLPAAMIAFSYLSPSHGESARQPTPLKPARPSRPVDVLRIPVIGSLLVSRPFRPVFQSVLVAAAIVVVADGLRGPQVGSMNLAGILPWTHWRGLTVIALLAIGNVFCMVCPFMFVRDLGRRVLRLNLVWPVWLRSKWPAIVLLVAFFFVYEFLDLWDRPAWTAVLIIGYFVTAFLVDGLFRGASFCKYVCPIGQFQFVASLVSPFEVRVRNSDVCGSCRTRDCIVGNASQRGCELELFQPRKSGNMDCTFCMDCVKACPHDNIGLLVSKAAADIIDDPSSRSSVRAFSQRPDIAVLVGALAVAAFLSAAAMTQPVLEARSVLARVLTPWAVDGLSLLVYVALLAGLPVLVGACCAAVGFSRVASRQAIATRACGFAIAFVPLAVAMWLAHFAFHLLAGFFAFVPVTLRLLSEIKLTHGPDDWAVPTLAFAAMPGVQILALGIGLLATLWLVWEKSKREQPEHAARCFLPWAAVALLLYTAGLWIFSSPMAMRGLSL